jgi:hypothetical protein
VESRVFVVTAANHWCLSVLCMTTLSCFKFILIEAVRLNFH